jgi:hypothetical protein
MKPSTIFTAILSTLILASCVKTESKKVTVPDSQKEMDEIFAKVGKKDGLKCRFLSDRVEKDVFLEIGVNKEGKRVVSFRDYNKAGKLSVLGAQLDIYSIIMFIQNDEGQENTLSAEGVLTTSNPEILLEKGEKLVTVRGQLSLHDNEYGTIDAKVKVLQEDNLIIDREFELGKIEACTSSVGSTI